MESPHAAGPFLVGNAAKAGLSTDGGLMGVRPPKVKLLKELATALL
jgi:hypothetical protein